MSILYNRLKSAEEGKKPDVALGGGEEFPIGGEIRRQKEERQRRGKLGIMVGILAFMLIIAVGLGIRSVKKQKPYTKQSSKSVVKPPPPSPKADTIQADASLPPEAVEQTKPEAEGLQKTLVEPAALSTNLFEQGTKLYKQRKYSDAANAYKQGLQDEPQQAVGYNNLGVVYYRQGKLQKALDQLEVAVELNPQYSEAHYNLGIVLEKLGQGRQALFHYLKFLEFVPPKQQPLQERVQSHVRHYY